MFLAAPGRRMLRRSMPPLLANGTLAAPASGVVLMGGPWFWERAVLVAQAGP